MTCGIQSSGAIELYFYGELPAGERLEVQSHLKQCAECRQALDELTVIRAALASRPDVATPPGADWSAFMARLDVAIHRESDVGRAIAGQDGFGRVPAASIRRRLVPYLAMAALLALVTVSVLRVMHRDGAVPPPTAADMTPSRGDASPAARADPALVALTGQHFERSKLVVLGLAMKDTNKPGDDDWTYERDLATTLLSDTRLYRVAAEERGMNTLAGVMRDLELVLLEASMSQEPDQASLEQLQRLIRRRDLLAKMNVTYTGS